MKYEIRSLTFDHVLTYQTRQLRTEWQEGILLMEDFTLIKDIYQNGPVFFSVEPGEDEGGYGNFTYYLPINEAIEVEEDPHFAYLPQLHIEEALTLRQADQTIDFHAAYEKVQQHAKDIGIALDETFYCVLLEVYGEYIIDLYVPLKNRGERK